MIWPNKTMKNKIDLLVIFLIILFTNQIAYSKPNIVVTIAPIASLVAMLTKDKADVVILDKSGGCPHHHSAKPSDKSLVDKAEMIIYIDDNFDNLISSMILNYKGRKVKISDFSSINFRGINDGINWHFWLDLENVKVLHSYLAEVIIQTFPEIANEVRQNLDEAIARIDDLDQNKRSELAELAPVALLSDSLEHFFKSINNTQLKVLQISNTSLKNMQKLDDVLSSDSIKCIVLDIDQSSQGYSKYNKIIVQLDSENWVLADQINLSGDLFIDQYSKMIEQLKLCK